MQVDPRSQSPCKRCWYSDALQRVNSCSALQAYYEQPAGARAYFMRLPPMAPRRTVESLHTAGALAERFGGWAATEKVSGRNAACIEVRDEFLQKSGGKTNGKLTDAASDDMEQRVKEILLRDGTLRMQGDEVINTHGEPWVWPRHKGTNGNGAQSVMLLASEKKIIQVYP
jgi:hypothetical protein